jgi:class 3 adenylate cyclase
LVASGAVVLYGLILAQLALLALGPRAAWWWFAAYVASVVYAVAVPRWVEPIYTRSDPETDVALALIGTGVVTFVLMAYFVRQRDRFQRRSDDLLHNILPEAITRRLKDSPTMIADAFGSASILFADVCDFTPMSAGMTPQELVALLDRVFTTFDGLVEELGLEKIKTVGDAYMVASGVPEPRADHAEAIAELALRMRDHAADGPGGHPLRLRIGINSGPVVAGIIGSHKFAYDLWGDAVNTASRMESAGVPGQIQITEATYELVRDRFACEPRGPIDVKGKGPMETYLLVDRRA